MNRILPLAVACLVWPCVGMPTSAVSSKWVTVDATTVDGFKLHGSIERGRLSSLSVDFGTCRVDVPHAELDVPNGHPSLESMVIYRDENASGPIYFISVNYIVSNAPAFDVQSRGRMDWDIRDCKYVGRRWFDEEPEPDETPEGSVS